MCKLKMEQNQQINNCKSATNSLKQLRKYLQSEITETYGNSDELQRTAWDMFMLALAHEATELEDTKRLWAFGAVYRIFIDVMKHADAIAAENQANQVQTTKTTERETV